MTPSEEVGHEAGVASIESRPGGIAGDGEPLERSLAKALILALGLVYWVADPSLAVTDRRLVFAATIASVGVATVWRLVRWSPIEADAWLVLALALAAVVIPSVVAPEARLASEAALPLVGACVVFAFVAGGGLSRVALMLGMSLAGAVMALMAIGDVVGSLADAWRLLGVVDVAGRSWSDLLVVLPRAHVAVAHPNHAAMVFGAAALAGVGLRWSGVPLFRRAGPVLAAIAVAALLLTGSRGGMIALVTGSVTLAFLTSRHRLGRRGIWIVSAAVGVLAVSFAGLYALGVRPSFLFRGTLGDRLPVVGAGLDMFADRILLGHGPGAFGWLADAYLDVYPGAGPRMVWNSAHNTFVSVLLERGVLGAVALSIALLLVGLGIRRSSDDAGSLTLGAILVGLLTHGLVDVVDWGIGGPAIVALVAGGVLQSGERRWTSPLLRGVSIGAVSVVAAVVPVFVLVTAGAARSYERGVAQAWAGDWESSAASFDEAAGRDSLPIYRSASLQGRLMNGGATTDLTPRDGPYPITGVDRLNMALDPTRRPTVVDLEELETAAWADEVALLQVGAMYDDIDAGSDADRVYRDVLTMNPWLASSPVWDRIPGGRDRMRDLVETLVRDQGCEAKPEWILFADITDSLSESIADGCAGGWARMAALATLGRDGELLELSRRSVEQVPDSPLGRRFLGLGLELGGDTEGARRQFAIGGLLGDPLSTLRLVELFEGDVPIEVVSLARLRKDDESPVVGLGDGHRLYRLASWRGLWVQRRITVPDPVVPGVWQDSMTGPSRGLTRVSG